MSTALSEPRRRLTREDRRRQLIETAWRIAQSEGADALTLGRLAEQAGVAKPVVYDHFGTRNGLLAALYKEFDDRQSAAMAEAFATSPETLDGRARVIADAYVACVLSQGHELFGVAAALAGSAELEAIKRQCDAAFLGQCKAALDPFSKGPLSRGAMIGFLGAAETLSHAAAAGEIAPDEARKELAAVILAAVERSRS